MQTTKILTALFLGLGGFWFFTQFSSSQARHILITDTAAHIMDNGLVALTFAIENTGPPDRIAGATSQRDAIEIRGSDNQNAIVIPVGKSALSLESAHLVWSEPSADLEPGTLIPLSLTLETGLSMSAFIKVADKATTPGLHSAMLHGAMAIDMGDPPPTVMVTAKRAGANWQLDIQTDHFEFDATAVDGAHVTGKGHGHLYVSGTKVGRVFKNSAQLGALPKGTHTVRVTLNTNNHVAYMANGKAVSATTRIVVDD